MSAQREGVVSPPDGARALERSGALHSAPSAGAPSSDACADLRPPATDAVEDSAALSGALAWLASKKAARRAPLRAAITRSVTASDFAALAPSASSLPSAAASQPDQAPDPAAIAPKGPRKRRAELGERQRKRRRARAAAKRARTQPAAPLDYFEAWSAAPTTGAHAAARAELELEREQARTHAAQASRTLHTALGAALVKYAGAELTPELERDIAAERQRAAAIAPTVPRKTAMQSRAELCHTLNAGHGQRMDKLIAQCREHVDDQDAAEARELAPNRRRPVSKRDVLQSKIHREARIMCAVIANSRGAYAIQSYLRRLRPIFSGQPLAALREGALQPLPQGGFRYTYADECARRVIGEGLLMLVVGKWTDQRTAFGSRSQARGLLVAGLTVSQILRAVTPVGRKPYDRHVFGSRTNDGWLGDMAKLERAGFATRKRLPVGVLNSWEVGTTEDGVCQGMNRYWIGCVVAESGTQKRSQNRKRPPAPMGDMLAVVVFSGSAHEIGWRWADETIAYEPTVPF